MRFCSTVLIVDRLFHDAFKISDYQSRQSVPESLFSNYDFRRLKHDSARPIYSCHAGQSRCQSGRVLGAQRLPLKLGI